MKLFLVLLIPLSVALLILGTPLPVEHPVKRHQWQSPEPILPMTFAHLDHVGENCLVCHHNYNDDTGNLLCMNCHVTNSDIWPLLETQFHDLCRDCHVDKQLLNEESGPTRACIDCHLDDELP